MGLILWLIGSSGRIWSKLILIPVLLSIVISWLGLYRRWFKIRLGWGWIHCYRLKVICLSIKGIRWVKTIWKISGMSWFLTNLCSKMTFCTVLSLTIPKTKSNNNMVTMVKRYLRTLRFENLLLLFQLFFFLSILLIDFMN